MGLDFMLEIRPVGAREIANAQYVFEGKWRLNRIRSIENDLFCFKPENEAGSTNPRLPSWERQVNAYREDFRRFDLISRYETRIVRNCVRVETDLDKLQKRRGKKRTFDEKSSPAIAWYNRLLIGVAKLETARSATDASLAPTPNDPPEITEKNSNKTQDPKRVTQTAAVGSTEISFGKKDRSEDVNSAPESQAGKLHPKARRKKAA